MLRSESKKKSRSLTHKMLGCIEMLTNVQKSLFRNGEENEKVIRNPHADPGQHQKSTTSRGSTPCPGLPRLVDVRFRVRQLYCLQNDRQNDHITSALSAEVKIIVCTVLLLSVLGCDRGRQTDGQVDE